ncbi:uncharacterized protein LOC108674218 [Hyalella azteca]|uniref:Uncharacterized protein LOC108674218 n=1 Tax=Hyalella azteca TaxID=294128 RepID=A0A8B7NV65_HYAAZ|nr:uncharacterized protein LOC108674218 [Hyalella azteca]
MEEFVLLEKELSASSDCVNYVQPLLDDRASGILHPYGGRMPPADHRDAFASGSSSSQVGHEESVDGEGIFLADDELDQDIPARFDLTFSTGHVNGATSTYASSGPILRQVPDSFDHRPSMLCSNSSSESVSNFHQQMDEPNFHEDSDIGPSPGFGNIDEPKPPMDGIDVRAMPPPSWKKETSKCKIQNKKVFIRPNADFYLKFSGLRQFFEATEIFIESKYQESSSFGTSVMSCENHFKKHVDLCKMEHDHRAFFCAHGMLKVYSECDTPKCFTPLSNVMKLEQNEPDYYVTYDMKLTPLCRNSCDHHKENGKAITLVVHLLNPLAEGNRKEYSFEFSITCSESPTRDSKPPVPKKRKKSRTYSGEAPFMTPPLSMSPTSADCSLDKKFTIMVPVVNSDQVLAAMQLLRAAGLSPRVWEHRSDF